MPNRKTIFMWIVLCCLMMLVLNERSAADTAVIQTTTFTDSGQNLGSDWSNDVALGDLDGDSDLDAFVINSTPASQVWLNQGGEQGGTMGLYQDSGQALDTVNGTAVALGDLDGDLDLDAFVVLSFSTDSHQVWINQGREQSGTEGVFVRNSHVVHDAPATNIILADVDNDTDLDAYITRVFNNDMLYLNNGSGLFSNSGQLLEAADSMAASFADVDGDLDLDIFVVTQTANEVWLNQGGSQGGTLGVFVDSGLNMGNEISLGVDMADLDGDNDLDAFVANALANEVWFNQGSSQGGTPGGFLDSGQNLGFSASNDIKLADLDGDSDVDAFVAEASANTVWINQGGVEAGTEGVFQDSGQSLGSSFSAGLALGDVDGDADLDAFVANNGPSDANKVYLGSSGPAQPPVNPEGWQIQLLAERGDSGHSPSIALDANGRPHIAYVTRSVGPTGRSSNHLYHQFWDGVRWQNELVTAVTRVVGTVSLALDSNDKPHIAFAANGGQAVGLIHASWDGGQWQMRQIESEDFGSNISLALDSQNNPHVSYAMAVNNQDSFRYARWDGSTWQKQTIETVTSALEAFTSLALDSNDRPHIVYFDEFEQTLKYAHYDGSSWQTNNIDTSAGIPFVDRFFSLALIGNTPAVAYYDELPFLDNTLNYAQWNGSSWQTQSLTTAVFPTSLSGNPSLAIDSVGNPHISYAYKANGSAMSLHSLHWDASQWQNDILDNSGYLAEASSLVLDANDKPHIAYRDQKYDDLRTISWGPNWQIRSLPAMDQAATVDVQVKETVPYLGYHNIANGLVQVAQWDDAWHFSSAAFVSTPVSQLSLAISPNRQHISYYQTDLQTLVYAAFNGSNWQVQTVDNTGDVGRYNHLLHTGNTDSQIRIAYWDETNLQVKLADYDVHNSTFQLHTNTAAPGLISGSGPLSAMAFPNRDIGIAYYDAFNTGLRFAVWEAATAVWTDELVDIIGGTMGRLNSVQMDDVCGCPVIAYYDETNDALKYAYKNSGGWQIETISSNAGGVDSLSLELGLSSRQQARLVYTTANEAHFAYQQNGVWQFETIAVGLNNPGAAALALDGRAHITYPDVLAGVQYVFRSATLDINTAVTTAPNRTAGRYNSFIPCGAVFDLFFWRFLSNRNPTSSSRSLSGATMPLSDASIFDGMAFLFSATPSGQDYINTYADHAVEMGQLGLDDPQLLWDAGGTLQNFLPGLEALVTGHGDQLIVTQQMVDDALDIWTRLAAAASPELANVINSQLTQTHDLQDFVGLTFAEWALAIGVNPPNTVYLPVISK